MIKDLYDTIRTNKGYAHVKFFVRHLIRFETEAGRHRIEEFLGASEGIFVVNQRARGKRL